MKGDNMIEYVNQKYKLCTKCGNLLEMNKFHMTRRVKKRKNMPDKVYIYRHAKCKNCRNETRREWYAEKDRRSRHA